MAEAPQAAKARPQPLIIGFLLTSAVCIFLAVATWYADRLPPVFAKSAALAFFVLTVPFLVFFHELGHFLAARAQGWRVPIFSLGPLALRHSPLRLHFGAPAFADASGAVFAVPPEGRDSWLGWAVVYAGGPAANLLFAALGGFVAYEAPPSSTPETMYFLFAVISLCSGVYNLIPFRGRGTDGAQLLGVLVHRNVTGRGLRARLMEQMIEGVRPRDWPPSLVNAVARDSLWLGDAQGQLFVYAWHMDRGEVAQARDALRHIRARGFSDEQVHAEEAFLLAQVDAKPAEARAAIARTHSWAIHHQPCYWRAEAAVCAAEGDVQNAREAVRKGRILCRDWPYATAYDNECFDMIEERIALAADGVRR
jgi:hypothetical protein